MAFVLTRLQLQRYLVRTDVKNLKKLAAKDVFRLAINLKTHQNKKKSCGNTAENCQQKQK